MSEHCNSTETSQLVRETFNFTSTEGITSQTTTKNCDNLTTLQTTTKNCDNLTTSQTTTKNCDNLTTSQTTTKNCDNLTTSQTTTKNCDNLTTSQTTTKNCDNLTTSQTTTKNCDNLTISQTTTKNCDNLTTSQILRKPSNFSHNEEMQGITTSQTPTKPCNPTNAKPKIQIAINHNQGYIWDPGDVLRLWRDLRVVGSLVGSLPRHPHQSSTLGLPLSLLPEEVTLLVDEGLGETVRFKEMDERPKKVLVDAFCECRERCYEEQVQEAARQRREEVRRMAGKILEGKRKKFMKKRRKEDETVGKGKEQLERTKAKRDETENGIEFTLTIEDVIREEEERLQPLPKNLQVIEIFTGQPLLDHLTSDHYHWAFPTTQDERVRYQVFRDLWLKGFYLTSGLKFGGHFLVYSGDPHLYHAHSIVRCTRGREFAELDLVASTRVAASTKKTFVLAYLDDGKIVYRSYHWFEEHEEEEVVDDFDEEL